MPALCTCVDMSDTFRQLRNDFCCGGVALQHALHVRKQKLHFRPIPMHCSIQHTAHWLTRSFGMVHQFFFFLLHHKHTQHRRRRRSESYIYNGIERIAASMHEEYIFCCTIKSKIQIMDTKNPIDWFWIWDGGGSRRWMAQLCKLTARACKLFHVHVLRSAPKCATCVRVCGNLPFNRNYGSGRGRNAFRAVWSRTAKSPCNYYYWRLANYIRTMNSAVVNGVRMLGELHDIFE